MEERRKSKRTELKSKLIMKRLGGDQPQEVGIDITDLSKSGIGFTCDEPLLIGNVYETFLTIWTKEVIHAFLEIVRIEKIEGTFAYGAFFVGMPEMDSSRIEVYQTVTEHVK